MVRSCFVYKPGCKISFGLTSPAVKNSTRPRDARGGISARWWRRGGQSSRQPFQAFHGYLRRGGRRTLAWRWLTDRFTVGITSERLPAG